MFTLTIMYLFLTEQHFCLVFFYLLIAQQVLINRELFVYLDFKNVVMEFIMLLGRMCFIFFLKLLILNKSIYVLCSCVENKWVKLMSLEEIKMIRGIKHYNIGNYNFIYIHETGSIFLKVGGGDVKLHFEHKIKVMCYCTYQSSLVF